MVRSCLRRAYKAKTLRAHICRPRRRCEDAHHQKKSSSPSNGVPIPVDEAFIWGIFPSGRTPWSRNCPGGGACFWRALVPLFASEVPGSFGAQGQPQNKLMPMRRNHRRRNSYAQIPKTELVLTATRRMMEAPLEELFFLAQQHCN
jgi:hypothetical protein